MQNFIKLDRAAPEKEAANERLKHFGEIYRLFDTPKAAAQAERCVQCGDPYCSVNGCPIHNHIPHWLKSIAEKNPRRAFLLSNENSPFPEILGRICPQERLCEGACTLGVDNFGAISIGAIETAIAERGFESGYEINYPAPDKNAKKVAVIGSGPASLSAATFLARAGIAVEIFEAADRAGGLLTYGIPGFKLNKSVVDRRFEMLKKSGAQIHLNHDVNEKNFGEILAKFDAVFVGVGARKPTSARIENEDAKGVYSAIDFLTASQKVLFGAKDAALFDAKDKNIVVIGGGDTAMDCVRAALRLGAKLATCVYRRSEADMPGSKKEFINAKEEGAEFIFNRAPAKIAITNGKVAAAVFALTKSAGRSQMEVVDSDIIEIAADAVIMALGFAHQEKSWLANNGVQLAENGAILVDQDQRASNPKIYAGGDAARGASLAVKAALDGKRAAFAIIKSLLK
ncbi:MAG: glutamate synthase subunit beta [Helicobacteraceae bacterium]|jgi:glutamate synthase (NADPH/NADH) small chain|nr:glutamate synthase subunit beta [Helicobacteraceae bacterium]